MALSDVLRGRQVIHTLTNRSGGGVVAGDVVVIGDGTNDNCFTTTTTASFNARMVGVALETIASLAAGRILLMGYAPIVNTNASVTRDYFLFTHTVAKEASGAASRAAGAFGQVLETGADPEAVVWGFPEPSAGAGIAATIFDAKGDLIAASAADTAARLAVGANGYTLIAASGESTGLKYAPRPDFRGAVAYNSVAQTISAATETTCLYDSENGDTNAFHDTSTNTGRMTVPAGFGGWYRVRSNCYLGGTPGSSYAYIRKNGTTAIDGSEDDSAANAISLHPGCTVQLVATDYLEVRVYRTSGTSTGNGTGSAANSFEFEFLGA